MLVWLQNQIHKLRKSDLHTDVSFASIHHYMYQGPYLKENKYEKWWNTIRLTLTSTCLLWLWLCANISKFKQIYFRNLKFCELAFLTHSFTTVFPYVFFFPYDFKVLGFEEKNYICKFFHIYKHALGPCQQCKINAYHLSHMLACFMLSHCWPYKRWNCLGDRRNW